MKKLIFGMLAIAFMVPTVMAASDYSSITDETTLKECMNQATATCTLGADFFVTTGTYGGEGYLRSRGTSGNGITLDLAGHTLTLDGQVTYISVDAGGTLTVTGGGKIELGAGHSSDYSKATVIFTGTGRTVNIENVTIDATAVDGAVGIKVAKTSDADAILNIGKDAIVTASGNAVSVTATAPASVTISGTIKSEDGDGVKILGSTTTLEDNPKITIEEGANISSTNGDAIDAGGNGYFDIKGGTITSENGYALKTNDDGTFNISGGDFSAPKQTSAISYSAGGNTNVSMTISGGEFSSLSEDILNKFIEGEATIDENGNIIIKPEGPTPTPTPGPEPTPEPTPDPMPDTGDTILFGITGLLVLATGCYVFKKVNE